jgi:hypothetical protein
VLTFAYNYAKKVRIIPFSKQVNGSSYHNIQKCYDVYFDKHKRLEEKFASPFRVKVRGNVSIFCVSSTIPLA